MGFGVIYVIIFVVCLISLLIASVFFLVDNKKVKKQVLVQGIIIILCGVTYGMYTINYEKSKKMHLKSFGTSSATTSDVPKSDMSSTSESEAKKKKQ